jgi:phosphoribosyl 1,2-cyclic phosphodiesterase
MSLFISSLASGSNGNCYYVGNQHEAVLVDAGISCKEIEMRMARLQLSLQKVKALFISHEHTDHIKGVANLSKKYRIPVYITPGTLRNGRLFLEKEMIRDFRPSGVTSVGNLTITAFPKWHDAADPCSFMVSTNGVNVGVFTDIGTTCPQLIHHFRQCHAAFLEANYDDHMLDTGGYPNYLKHRIRGEKGHLSNKQALELFTTYRPAYMSHLVLSHISKNNNCPKLVNELFSAHAAGVKIIVASRYEETNVYAIQQEVLREKTSLPKGIQFPQLEFAFA